METNAANGLMAMILEYVKYEFMGIAAWQYLAAFGLILLGYVLKRVVVAVLGKARWVADKTTVRIDDIVITALERPLGTACVLGGLALAVVILPLPTEPLNIERFAYAVLRAASTLLVIWFLVRLSDGLMSYWEERAEKTESKFDNQFVPILRKSLKAFLVVIGLVMILQHLGYSVTSLLAGLGIGTAAIALASKDTLANLFGSIVIFVDRPFAVGDWVEIGSVEGTVEEVGLRVTRIRTFANSLITIPNSQLTTTAINNWSRMKKRRIKMRVGLTYDTTPEQMEAAVLKIREAIESDPNLHHDFYLVNFEELASSSLNIFIYCFTVTTNWAEHMQAKQEFLLRLMRVTHELGLEFAFPTQTLHVPELTLESGAPEAMLSDVPR
ncbi:MAG: mechanosensitive ion channel family protein [Candidatus Alcyoniella australis]|nr:mechanosensitive ion channel family protein [Candidatus Alcyoniella australis]